MAVAAVVRDDVEEDSNPAISGLANQLVDI